MNSLSIEVIQKIETLCNLGCTEVNALLAQAKDGKYIEVLSGFNKTEVEQIIGELNKIMSVYTTKN